MTIRKGAGEDIVPPHIPQELLDYLRSVFRDRLPPISISDRELGRLIGQQDVIRDLEVQRENQLEEAANVST